MFFVTIIIIFSLLSCMGNFESPYTLRTPVQGLKISASLFSTHSQRKFIKTKIFDPKLVPSEVYFPRNVYTLFSFYHLWTQVYRNRLCWASPWRIGKYCIDFYCIDKYCMDTYCIAKYCIDKY